MIEKRTEVLLILLLAVLSLRIVLFFTDRDPDLLLYVSEVPRAHALEDAKPVWKATHLKTPESVRAIYMTSWVAGTPSLRKGLVKIIDDTEVNAVIIDIKDYTGRISFPVEDPMLLAIGSVERRVPDMREFIAELHGKGVYVIGRISASTMDW